MRFIVVSTFFISNSALKFPILQWIYRIRQEMTKKRSIAFMEDNFMNVTGVGSMTVPRKRRTGKKC